MTAVALAGAALCAISAVADRTANATIDTPAKILCNETLVAPRALAKFTCVDAVLNVRTDMTAELVQTRRVTVLAPQGIKAAGQQAVTYIDGIEQLEVIEAYTEKPDGKTLPVPAERIFTRDAAIDSDNSYLVDQKARTVFFPHVAVGDTVVLKTRLQTRSATFPGHFVTQFLHSRDIGGTNATLKITPADEPHELPGQGSTYRIVAPRELALRVGAAGEGLTRTVFEDERTITHVITLGAVAKSAATAKSISPLERDPRILVSTLRSYEELGKLYWASAAPQAQVTPEIQALAEAITRGIDDRRGQAKAISDWVKSNVRYLVIFSGSGRELPRNSAESILRNRYGDCKDKAVLTMALLAAKGIASELVMIYLGNVHSLPEPPTLAYFNHLMLYVPEFSVFDDPTSNAVFGELVSGGYDKPVVIVSAAGARVDATPPQPRRR